MRFTSKPSPRYSVDCSGGVSPPHQFLCSVKPKKNHTLKRSSEHAVVTHSPDIAVGHVHMMVQTHPLTGREVSVRNHSPFLPPDPLLLRHQPARLPGRETAAANAMVNPVLLPPLPSFNPTVVNPPSTCRSGPHCHNDCRHQSGYHNLFHVRFSFSHKIEDLQSSLSGFFALFNDHFPDTLTTGSTKTCRRH